MLGSIRDLMFYMPFPSAEPSATYADLGRLRDWLRDWLYSHGVIKSEAEWRGIDNWRIPEFAAYTYPGCRTDDDARIVCAWLAWTSHFDDQFDHPSLSRDPENVRAHLAPYFRYTAEARTGRSARPDSPDGFLSTFTEQVAWTCQTMTPGWRNRYLDDLDAYLRTYIDEADHRARGVILPVDELVVHRRVCMAMGPTYDLTERVYSGELSPATRILLDPLANCATDALGALNDAASYARERACDDSHNLVVSMVHHRNMTTDEAIQETVRFAEKRVQEYQHFAVDLIDNPAIEQERGAVERFRENCETWVRGYYDWLLETKRFEVSSISKCPLSLSEGQSATSS